MSKRERRTEITTEINVCPRIFLFSCSFFKQMREMWGMEKCFRDITDAIIILARMHSLLYIYVCIMRIVWHNFTIFTHEMVHG